MSWPGIAESVTGAAIAPFLEDAVHRALDGTETDVRVVFELERTDVELFAEGTVAAPDPRAYFPASGALGREPREGERLTVRGRMYRVRRVARPDDGGWWADLAEA